MRPHSRRPWSVGGESAVRFAAERKHPRKATPWGFFPTLLSVIPEAIESGRWRDGTIDFVGSTEGASVLPPSRGPSLQATDSELPKWLRWGIHKVKRALYAGGKLTASAEHSLHGADTNSRRHVCLRHASNISLAREAYISSGGDVSENTSPPAQHSSPAYQDNSNDSFSEFQRHFQPTALNILLSNSNNGSHGREERLHHHPR